MMLSALTVSTPVYASSNRQTVARAVNLREIFKSANIVHFYNIIEIKQSSCVQRGYIKSKCILCGKVTTVYGSIKEHRIVVDPAVPSTCSQTGLTQGSHCSACGKVIVKQEETMMLACDIKSELAPATVNQDGYYLEYCVNCDYHYKKVIPKPKAIKLSLDNKNYETEFEYTGNAVNPYVKVLDANGNEISSANYTVKISNNTNVGTATVSVKLFGEYDGIMTGSFSIIQSKEPADSVILQTPSVIKAQTGSVNNSISFNFTCSLGATAYDVQYSTNSNFANAKTVRIKPSFNGSWCTATVKLDVKKGTSRTEKQYYIRIRSIDTENKITSNWSKSYSVKIYVQNI